MQNVIKYTLIIGWLFVCKAAICVESGLVPSHAYQEKGDIVIIKNKEKADFIDGEKFFFVGNLQKKHVSCFSLCRGFLGWQCMDFVHPIFYESLCTYLLKGTSASIALQDTFSDIQKAVGRSPDVNVQSTAAAISFALTSYDDTVYISHGLCRAFVFRKNSSGLCEYEELLSPLLSLVWGFGSLSNMFLVTSFPTIFTYKVRANDYALFVAPNDFFEFFSPQNIADAMQNESYAGSFIDTVRDWLSISYKKNKKIGTGSGCMVIPLIKEKNRKVFNEIHDFIVNCGILGPHPETGKFIKDFLQKVNEFIKKHKKNKTINVQTSGKFFNLLVISFLEVSIIMRSDHTESPQMCKNCISCFYLTISELMGNDMCNYFSTDQQEYMKKWQKKLQTWYLQKIS